MILFLHGPDTYTSRQKLNALKAKFIEKNGEINLSVFEGVELSSLAPVKEALDTAPFLGSKRMIIIHNSMSGSKKSTLADEWKALLDTIPEDRFLVFYEDGEIDKRTALFKKLNKPKCAEEFKPLSAYELSKWITTRLKELGGQITADAITELTVLVGSNLWQLEQELQKLVLYKHGTEHAITVEDVKQFVHGSITTNIFKMIDYIGQKRTKLAVAELEQLKLSGENEVYLLTMIVYQFRNLIQARDILNQGGNKADLASQANLHPFVADKCVRQAENFSLDELKAIYRELMELDHGMKTGRVDPSLALDTFVVTVGTGT